MVKGDTVQTVLVTGGAGFIGSSLVRQLFIQNRYRVVVLDKLTYAGNLESLGAVLESDRVFFVHGGIEDSTVVAELLSSFKPVALIHLAAESHVDRSIDGPAAFVMTNVVGTFRLLESALDYFRGLPNSSAERFRFLHVSTDEVYGSVDSASRSSEGAPYAPNSPYAASKAASDHFVRAYYKTYGLPTLITNCSNNYGPYQFPEKLIPLMILNALEGKPLPVYGDGQNVRDWLYVEDHCSAICDVLQHGRPGDVYNIGGNSEMTNLAVVHKICGVLEQMRPGLKHAPLSSLITFVADRPGHDRRYAIDTSKIEKEIGWKPSYDFETGIAKTVQWYLDNPEWVQRVTDGSYRRERLGVAR